MNGDEREILDDTLLKELPAIVLNRKDLEKWISYCKMKKCFLMRRSRGKSLKDWGYVIQRNHVKNLLYCRTALQKGDASLNSAGGEGRRNDFFSTAKEYYWSRILIEMFLFRFSINTYFKFSLVISERFQEGRGLSTNLDGQFGFFRVWIW